MTVHVGVMTVPISRGTCPAPQIQACTGHRTPRRQQLKMVRILTVKQAPLQLHVDIPLEGLRHCFGENSVIDGMHFLTLSDLWWLSNQLEQLRQHLSSGPLHSGQIGTPKDQRTQHGLDPLRNFSRKGTVLFHVSQQHHQCRVQRSVKHWG